MNFQTYLFHNQTICEEVLSISKGMEYIKTYSGGSSVDVNVSYSNGEPIDQNVFEMISEFSNQFKARFVQWYD